jgi:hypothetical protein
MYIVPLKGAVVALGHTWNVVAVKFPALTEVLRVEVVGAAANVWHADA